MDDGQQRPDCPYRYSVGMNEQTALDVEERIHGMGFEAWTLVDDFGQFQVCARTPDEGILRFRTCSEYDAWYDHWCDTHLRGA